MKIIFSFLYIFVFSCLTFPANTYAEKLSVLALKCINDKESCPKVENYLMNNIKTYEDLRLKCLVDTFDKGVKSDEIGTSCVNASIWEILHYAHIYESEFEKRVRSAGIKNYSYTFATDNICLYGFDVVDRTIFVKSCELSSGNLIHRAFKRPKNMTENFIYFNACTLGENYDSCYYVEDDVDANSEKAIKGSVRMKSMAFSKILNLSQKKGIKIPSDTKKAINDYIENVKKRKQELLKIFKEQKEAENTGDVQL